MVSDQGLYEIHLDFVLKFGRLLRSAKIYSSENETLERHLDECLELMQTISRDEKTLSLKILMDAIFVNDGRIKVSKETYPKIKFIMDELQDRMIGEIVFLDRVSRAELKGFLKILLGSPGAGNHAGRHIVPDRLIQEKIYSIVVKPFDPLFVDENLRKQTAKKLYFRSIAMVKEVCRNLTENKPLALRKAKRLTQSMVDLFGYDTVALMGLTTIKNYDEYTYNHSVNVCVYSLAIGKRLGFSKKTLAELGLAALLHDVGKVKIPDTILRKPDKLDGKEWDIIKSHPMAGVEEILEFQQFAEVHPRILFGIFDHHLSFDASGYPSLKRKKKQTLFGKIVTIADVYDALTTPRCYRKEVYSATDALKLMWKECGIHFDPTLFKVFVHTIGVYPVGSLVQLDDNELAVVSENPQNAQPLDRPNVWAITSDGAKGRSINLSERDGKTRGFSRSIVRCVDPKKYDITVQEHFL